MFYESFLHSVSRRAALGGILGAGIALAAAPAAAARRSGTIRPLDINDPRENLYGFAKMWGTIGPKAVLSGYQGVQYAVVGTQRAGPCSATVASAISGTRSCPTAP